jgi:hypothetical protein
MKESGVQVSVVRCAMGLKISPYQAIQGLLRAEAIIRGDSEDEKRQLFWASRTPLTLQLDRRG